MGFYHFKLLVKSKYIICQSLSPAPNNLLVKQHGEPSEAQITGGHTNARLEGKTWRLGGSLFQLHNSHSSGTNVDIFGGLMTWSNAICNVINFTSQQFEINAAKFLQCRKYPINRYIVFKTCLSFTKNNSPRCFKHYYRLSTDTGT